MKPIEITLIIPNYNNALFLEQCILSAVSQTYKFSRILIIDDASTDNSKDIVLALSNKYSCVEGVFLESNRGVSNARNVGLAMAKTEYVTFMDSDDFYFDENKIQNEVQLINQYKKIGKDILSYSMVVFVDNEGAIVHKTRYLFKNQFVQGRALNQMISLAKMGKVPRDYVIKKDIVLKAGGYSFYKDFYEDLDLLMRLAKQDILFECTFKYGTCYRQTINGLSKNKKYNHQETIKEISNHYYRELSPFNKVAVLIHKLNGLIFRCITLIPKSLFDQKKRHSCKKTLI